MTPFVPARRPDPAAVPPSLVSRVRTCAGAPPAAVSALLAFLLGLWQLDRHASMWRDEAVTYDVAHRSIGDILRLSQHVDVVHVVYYLLMHGVFSVWDGGLIALRLPSVLAVAVAAGFVGAIGNLLGGARHGFVAGAAFATLPLVQKYAQEGRSYALVLACVAAMTYLLVRHAREGHTRLLVGYTLVAIVACWLNEFAVLAVLAHAVAAGSRRQRLQLAACAVVIIAAISPLLAISRSQTGAQLYWLDTPDTRDLLQFAGLSIVCALGARLSYGHAGPLTERRLAVSLWVVPSTVLLAVSILYEPYYVDRYVLYGAIGLSLSIARVVEFVAGRAAARGVARAVLIVIVAAVLIPWTIYNRYPSTRKDDVIAIERTLHHVLRPGDGVLFVSAKHREWTQWTGRQDFDDLALAQDATESGTLYGREASPEVVARRILTATRIVALENPHGFGHPGDVDDLVKVSLLRTDFLRCAAYPERGGLVVVYARSNDLCGATG